VTFLQLYGDALDRELGTADRSQLFTLARRKAAINAAQLEWLKRTECFQRQISYTLTSSRQEYDLEAATNFGWIAEQGISIKIVSGSTTRYIEGDDLEVTTIARLNVEEPGWRAEAAGTPRKVYMRRTGGAVNLGLHPAPSISGSDTWYAIVQIVVVPADMSDDADEPFTCSGNTIASLRPWHRALPYYAAFDLEKFRKDAARQQANLQLWEVEVERFIGLEKPKGGRHVRFAKPYRQRVVSCLYPRRWDPRT
jgi:hypothetical protein